jgi:hypothetical protein
MVSRKVKE